ncbi:MAG: molybdate ABC transporter permease subunit [Gemmatimonadetes bacterium]|nr:molybdate ABC transporter permease subunit [Gemmatimonadota bacterium]
MSGLEREALLLSIRVGLVATLVILPPGVALGWLLARREFRLRTIVDALLTLPLVLPPVVTGWILLVLFGTQGVLGAPLARLGLHVAFTWKAAALASAALAFPLLVRTVQVAIASVDARLEEAARTLGASPLRVFWTVTLPLASRGVIAGAVLAFARSIGEFGATISFAGNVPGQTRTLPLAIWSELQVPGAEMAAARLVALSVALAVVALVAAEVIRRRGELLNGSAR